MKIFKSRILAASIATSLCLSAPLMPMQANASGILVFDGANVSQTAISAIQNIAAVLKQIEQYQTQLKQYENQTLSLEVEGEILEIPFSEVRKAHLVFDFDEF